MSQRWPTLPESFRSMNQLRVLLLPPGWDASPSQGDLVMNQLRVLLLLPGWDASPLHGYPQHFVAGTHLYTWVERDNIE